MKCPLLNPKVYTTDSGHTLTKGDCLKEACAWWNNKEGICAVLSLARNLDYIERNLRK